MQGTWVLSYCGKGTMVPQTSTWDEQTRGLPNLALTESVDFPDAPARITFTKANYGISGDNRYKATAMNDFTATTQSNQNVHTTVSTPLFWHIYYYYPEQFESAYTAPPNYLQLDLATGQGGLTYYRISNDGNKLRLRNTSLSTLLEYSKQ